MMNQQKTKQNKKALPQPHNLPQSLPHMWQSDKHGARFLSISIDLVRKVAENSDNSAIKGIIALFAAQSY